MTNIYYTAREGRRNRCGHTTTGIEKAGIDTNGGYYGSRWREAVNLIEI